VVSPFVECRNGNGLGQWVVAASSVNEGANALLDGHFARVDVLGCEAWLLLRLSESRDQLRMDSRPNGICVLP